MNPDPMAKSSGHTHPAAHHVAVAIHILLLRTDQIASVLTYASTILNSSADFGYSGAGQLATFASSVHSGVAQPVVFDTCLLPAALLTALVSMSRQRPRLMAIIVMAILVGINQRNSVLRP